MAISVACCAAANSIDTAGQTVAASAPVAAASPRPASMLEHRVTLLAAELGLDAQQQAAVRAILEDQRRQVANLWNDNSVPPAYRVNATRIISDRTGDRIRALLNEEQKTKYNRARKPRESAEQTGALSVEDWMKAANPK